MTEKMKISHVPSKIVDRIKWSSAVLLFLMGLGANYYYSAEPLVLRLSGWVVLSGVIAVIIFQTIVGKQLWRFFKASRVEMRKVVWPTRHETFHTTLMVIAIIIVFAMIMWGADSFFLWAIGWLTGQRG